MTTREALLRSAEILERRAQSLRLLHTFGADDWVLLDDQDHQVKAEHDELVEGAEKLREMLEL